MKGNWLSAWELINLPSQAAFRQISYGYPSSFAPHMGNFEACNSYHYPEFSHGFMHKSLLVVSGLKKHPLFTAFPSLSHFSTYYRSFLNPLDKLPVLKSSSQDYSGHFPNTYHSAMLVHWVGTWFKPSQLESFPGNFVQPKRGRKELSFLIYYLPVIVFPVEQYLAQSSELNICRIFNEYNSYNISAANLHLYN